MMKARTQSRRRSRFHVRNRTEVLTSNMTAGTPCWRFLFASVFQESTEQDNSQPMVLEGLEMEL